MSLSIGGKPAPEPGSKPKPKIDGKPAATMQ